MAPQLPEFCKYYTTRKVRLINTHVSWDSLGFWYRLTQALTLLVALSFTIGYNIIHKDAYKEYGTITSDVRVNLVGSLHTVFNESELDNIEVEDLTHYNKFWDLNLINEFAPEMENSFFVPTNVFVTANQERSSCPDFEQSCKTDSDCVPSNKFWEVNDRGVKTGSCVPTPGNKFYCEVTGWCPLEPSPSIPSSTKAILENTKNFQIEIINEVQFSQFHLDGASRANFFIGNVVEEAIKRHNDCKRCRSYKAWVSDIIDGYMGRPTDPTPRKTKHKKITYHDIAMKGGLINVYINWSCYMGLQGSSQTYFRKHCKPTYKFDLMPSQESYKDINRQGKFVHKSDYDGRRNTKRDLYKTYGIWFRFFVTSDVSRFDMMNTLKVLFVGLGLVKVSYIIFDFLAPKLFCCNKKLESEEYLKVKYIDIEDEDDTSP